MSERNPDQPPKVRLFFALDLPDAVRDAIAAWQLRECGDPALRVVRPEALHVTLAFLGHRPEHEVELIAEAGLAQVERAPELRFEAEPARRPAGGRPRLFALSAESAGTVGIQAELSARLEDRGLYRREHRPFWPHVTVARVRRAERGKERPARVADPPGPLPEELTRPFGAVRIALYRSRLRPQGAEYAPLHAVELT